MRGDGCFIRISLMVLAIGFSVGCGKEEPAASQPSLTPPLAGNWQATMPAKFAGLSVKDGGTCYLDAVNAVAIGDTRVAGRVGGCRLEGGAIGKRRRRPVACSDAIFYCR